MFPLGKMEINSVAGLISLTKSQSPTDDNPSLQDIDTPSDEDDEYGKGDCFKQGNGWCFFGGSHF
jgi:hypothetical protein